MVSFLTCSEHIRTLPLRRTSVHESTATVLQTRVRPPHNGKQHHIFRKRAYLQGFTFESELFLNQRYLKKIVESKSALSELNRPGPLYALSQHN